MSWTYEQKSPEKLKKWYASKKNKGESLFTDFEDFKEWYDKQKKVCFYCGLSEEESQEIVHNGVLKSKRFPEKGIFKRGRNRGYWLEIDRKDPKSPNGKYSRENCVLSCYFCNNDKSDVFTDLQYKDFVKNRVGFLKSLK